MYCKKKIKKIVNRLKIVYEDMSIYTILQERDIVVVPISGDKISKGAYEMYRGIQFIYINTDLSTEEIMVTLAHELGHSILHPDIDTFELKLNKSYYFLNKYERQADFFAAEFLLPDSIIYDFNSNFDEVGSGVLFSDVASNYQVTEDLVKLKLSNFDKPNFIESPHYIESFIPPEMFNTSYNYTSY